MQSIFDKNSVSGKRIKSQQSNFVQEVPDSHFWPSIKIFLNWLDCVNFRCQDFTVEYIRTGFENALKHGYDLRKRKRNGKK